MASDVVQETYDAILDRNPDVVKHITHLLILKKRYRSALMVLLHIEEIHDTMIYHHLSRLMEEGDELIRAIIGIRWPDYSNFITKASGRTEPDVERGDIDAWLENHDKPMRLYNLIHELLG